MASRKKQYWALRSGLLLKRTTSTSAWPPVDEIKRIWPDRGDDIVFMAALTPTTVDRPLVDRWACEYEIVALSAGKRESERLYRELTALVSAERTRRALVKPDWTPESYLLDKFTDAETRYKQLIGDVQRSIESSSFADFVTRTWGTSLQEAINVEVIYTSLRKFRPSMDAVSWLEGELAAFQDTVLCLALASGDYVNYRDHFLNSLKARGVYHYRAKVQAMLDEVHSIKRAIDVQAQIDVHHRRDYPSPTPSSKE